MDYDGVRREMQNDIRHPTRVATNVATLANQATSVIEISKNNPVLQYAGQILETLTDVGKVMPFVAPAFVLLKVIIDIERKAEEVDAKCNDLIERITFMLSHLPALQKIEVLPATRQVIDHMNEAIKAAAALIGAYRKQGGIARRLSLSNRDKFTTCAGNINSCCNDLLMSLQIHQTVKLDILTRAVPFDKEDAAAQTFVAAHGGSVDAVLHDRELVKEFAHQQNFTMDDSVMEHLNANIADSIQQNSLRLEGLLKENVSTAISDGLKNLALEMNAMEAEQKFKCIQCDKQFTNHTNGPNACSFHRAEYDSWSKHFPCCSTANPCQFGAHRAKHHCDYPYGNFFPRVWAITRYIDTNESWAEVEDTNLENGEVQRASVGQLIRWVSKGTRVEEATLIIMVGTIWFTSPYYFNTFTAKELEDITKSVRHSRRTLIFRTSTSDKEYALAEWILSISGKITGIRLTAKSTTSTTPFVRVCPIDLTTCKKSGDILTLSEGGLRSYTPASPYELPETLQVSPILPDEPCRAVRTNFKTRTSPNLKVILKTMSDPPLLANPKFANDKFDYFVGKVSMFNNNAPGSLNPVTIAAVTAEFRLIGESEYQPVLECTLIDNDILPLTVEPRQSWQINFQVSVPRTEEDAKLEVKWWNRAFVPRHRPLRLKLVLEDIEGEQCSLVLEYVFKPYPPTKRSDTDLGFFFFDDYNICDRRFLKVEPPSSEGDVIRIGANDFSVKRLQKIVYGAITTGESEVDLKIGQEKDYGQWEWAAWALVDLSCKRVYAFKIMIIEGKNVPVKKLATLGYVPCPTYGDVIKDTRPISYAKEIAKLPDLQPYPVIDFAQDDTLDDFRPPIPPKPSSPTIENSPLAPLLPGGAVALPVDLANRLVSIDSNLARIAAALEGLVANIPASNGSAK